MADKIDPRIAALMPEGGNFKREQWRHYTIRDQISFLANAASIRVPAFCVIDRLGVRQQTPGEHLLGTAVALVAMAQACHLSPQELIMRAERVLVDVEGPFTHHAQAIREYAKQELLFGGDDG
jgi:hypothetical protein